jgi:hypothetical protein
VPELEPVALALAPRLMVAVGERDTDLERDFVVLGVVVADDVALAVAEAVGVPLAEAEGVDDCESALAVEDAEAPKVTEPEGVAL